MASSPAQLKNSSDKLLLELIEFAQKSAHDKDLDVFEFRTKANDPDSEIIARARFKDGMVVDLRCGTAECPTNIKEFSSVNAWAAACKGRAVSVKPFIFFKGVSLRKYEENLQSNPDTSKVSTKMVNSDGEVKEQAGRGVRKAEKKVKGDEKKKGDERGRSSPLLDTVSRANRKIEKKGGEQGKEEEEGDPGGEGCASKSGSRQRKKSQGTKEDYTVKKAQTSNIMMKKHALSEGDMPRDLSASAAEEQKLKKAKADEIQKLKELGDKAVKQSNWEDAIEHYTSGIEIFRRAHDLEVEDGEEAMFYSKRATAYCYVHQFQSALQDAQKCINLAPKIYDGYQCKAAALVATQKHDDAIATLKHGLALCPNDLNLKQALLNLGVMHKDTLEKPIAASSSSNLQKSKKRDRAGEGAGLEDLEAGLHTADDVKDEKKGKDERLKPEEGVEGTESQEEDMTDVDDSRQVSGKDKAVNKTTDLDEPKSKEDQEPAAKMPRVSESEVEDARPVPSGA